MIVSATTRYKSWQVRCSIDGRQYTVIGIPSRSIGLDQGRSSIALELRSMPPITSAGTSLVVDIGCNGRWRRFFTGLVAPDSMGVPGISRVVNGVDTLARLNKAIPVGCESPGGIEFVNNTFVVAVTKVLTAGGITAGDIHSIYDPGAMYMVGSVEAICIDGGENLAGLLAELLAYGGAAAYVLPSGRLRIVNASRVPSSGYGPTFAGSTVGASDYRIFSARRTIGLFEDAISSVIASGPGVEFGIPPEATFTIAGVTGKSESFQNRFIQTIPQAEAIAEREVRNRARLERIIDIDVPLDPDILPGQSVGFRYDLINYPATTGAYVVGARTNGTSMSLSLSLGPSLVAGFSSILPPLADFASRVVTETLSGTGVVELFLDGTLALSQNGGVIVSYVWSTSTPVAALTPVPPSASTAPHASSQFVFIYPAATTAATITLLVTDDFGKTATITKTIALNGSDGLTIPTTQGVHIAMGSVWYASSDGGASWASESGRGDAIALPPVGAGADVRAVAGAAVTYGLLATRGAGGTSIRRSLDFLRSTSADLASLGGAVSWLWQNERNPARVWAVTGTSVRRSIDGGATFAIWGTLPAAVQAMIEDPVVDNSVFVLAANMLYHSLAGDPPDTNWSALYTGPVAAVAKSISRARSGDVTWIGFTGTFTGSPLQRVEGSISVTFPVLAPVVSQIRVVCLDANATYVYAFDDQGRVFRADAVTGTGCVQITSMPALPGGTPHQAVADPVADIIYVAANDGAHKIFGGTGQRHLFKAALGGEQGHMIGLGGAHIRPPSGVLVLPFGSMHAAVDRIHQLSADGIWSSAVVPPLQGWFWHSVSVNPLNTQQWLLYGNGAGFNDARVARPNVAGGTLQAVGTSVTPLYYSGNAGASWVPISLTGWHAGTSIVQMASAPCWDRAGNWYMIGVVDKTNNASDVASRIWVGRGATVTATANQDNPAIYAFAPAGNEGLVGFAYRAVTSPAAKLCRILPNASVTFTSGNGSDFLFSYLGVDPATFKTAALRAGATDNAGRSTDATTSQLSVVTASGVTYVVRGQVERPIAVTSHGVYTADATVNRYSDWWSSGVPASTRGPQLSGGSFLTGNTDPLGRTYAALETSVTAIGVHLTTDGVTWQFFPGPLALTDANTARWIEAIPL